MCSFDIIRDELGGPRATFPHTLTLAAGTQAAHARANAVALVKLANLGQGKHGAKVGSPVKRSSVAQVLRLRSALVTRGRDPDVGAFGTHMALGTSKRPARTRSRSSSWPTSARASTAPG